MLKFKKIKMTENIGYLVGSLFLVWKTFSLFTLFWELLNVSIATMSGEW